jgi:hypothetical protein
VDIIYNLGMAEEGQEKIDRSLKDSRAFAHEGDDLLKAYFRIADSEKRKKILDLIITMSKES